MARGEWMRGLRQFLLRDQMPRQKRPASPGQVKSLGVRKHDSLALSYLYAVMGTIMGFWSRSILNNLEHWAYFDGFKLSAPLQLQPKVTPPTLDIYPPPGGAAASSPVMMLRMPGVYSGIVNFTTFLRLNRKLKPRHHACSTISWTERSQN